MAVNNYRKSGSGGFPDVASAPVVYNRQIEIRQLLIDWVAAHRRQRPGRVRVRGLAARVQGGEPITVV